MKIIEKHTYSIDIIELKLGLDEIINNSPNINNLTDFENNYTIIIEKAINQLIDKNFIKKSELKEILKNKLYLPIKENDISETLFFILLSYQLIIKDTYLAPLILDFHYSFSLEKNNFMNNIEFGLIENTKLNLEQLDFDEDLLHEISKWCVKKRETENISYENFSNPKSIIDEDKRINTGCSTTDIEKYFSKLYSTKGEDPRKSIMKKEDVEHLLCVNFKGFEKREKKLLLTNIKKKNSLRYFVYQFYKYLHLTSKLNQKDKYINLLYNFNVFSNTNKNDLSSNFSREVSKSPILYESKFD